MISITQNTIDSELFQNHISNNLEMELLAIESLYAYVSKNSPLAKKKSISMKELLKYPLVVHDYMIASFGTDILNTFGSPNIVLSSSNIKLLVETVSNGLSVGFCSGYLLKSTLNNEMISIIPIKENLKYSVCLIYQKEPQHSLAVKEFINLIKSQIY